MFQTRLMHRACSNLKDGIGFNCVRLKRASQPQTVSLVEYCKGLMCFTKYTPDAATFSSSLFKERNYCFTGSLAFVH